jgi:hypothetical protein
MKVKAQIAAPFSATILQQALDRQCERAIGIARAYLAEYRKAIAADTLYADLRGMSAAELSKHGLRRRNLAQFIRDRLYPGAIAPSSGPHCDEQT